MKNLLYTFCAIALLLSMQSCYVKRGSNMSFVDRSLAGRDAEIVSMRMPMFLARPFIVKELASEENELIRKAILNIKSVKFMALSNAQNTDRIYKSFSNYLDHQNMEEFASLYSDGSRISINGKIKKNKIKKLLLCISDDQDQIYVEVKGNFSMDDISNSIQVYEKKSSL